MAKINIEKKTQENKLYRKILYTDKFMQVAIMNLNPREAVPNDGSLFEIHNGSQFIRVESGGCAIKIGDKRYNLADGQSVVVAPNTEHFVQAGKNGAKLYTIYSPPQH